MGFGGISTWQLLILLLVIVLIFGTRKVRNMGGDLGAALKGFKKGLNEGDEEVSGEPDQLAAEEPSVVHSEEAAEPAEKA